MPIDRRHLGKRYGPYVFEVGLERIRDFVAAVGGGVPGRVFLAPPPDPDPLTWDEQAARAGPHGGIVAPPAFATVFAMQPFAAACSDPELDLNVLRLVHAEQAFEWSGPIRPGDVMHTVGEITSIRDRGNLDFLEVTTTSTDARGALRVKGIWTAIIRN